MSRLETGVIQEEGDWPGVFIRGDNAMQFSIALEHAIGRLDWDQNDIIDVTTLASLRALSELLASSNASTNPKPQMVVRVTEGTEF